MSFTRKIIEGARSGLSQLTELVVVDDEPLSHVDGAALEAELAARKASRARRGRRPEDNPVARLAMPAARADRERQAAERAQRIHGERAAREAKAKAASDDAFRRIKEEAARTPPPGPGASSASSSSGSGASSSGASRPGSQRPRSSREAAQLAEWYKALDLAPGAELAEVKAAYRKLMRKYHPDLHAANPQKQKAATELSMRVTSAYNALSAALEKK